MTFLTPSRSGMALVLAAMAMLVANDAAMKTSARAIASSECLFLRAVFACLCALALLRARGELADLRQGLRRLVVLRGAIECAGSFLFLFAVTHMPIGDATAIVQIAPLLLMALSALVFGERVGLARLGACAVGFMGALLVAAPSGDLSLGALFALLTASGVALRETIARHLGAEIGAVALTCVTCAMVALSATLGAWFEPWTMPGPVEWALTLAAGIFLMGGYTAITLAVRRAAIQTVAPFYYSQTLFALLAGAVLFGDAPTPMGLLGVALVLASGLFVFASQPAGPAILIDPAP